MTKRTYKNAKLGHPVQDVLIEQLADEAEACYDVDEVISRRCTRADGRDVAPNRHR